MNEETIDCAGEDNIKLARLCLRLIAKIAQRGASSQSPEQIGYALQELTQVLFERTGDESRVFEPVEPSQISDLPKLFDELDFVNCAAEGLKAASMRSAN
jgi:hypothetical protein